MQHIIPFAIIAVSLSSCAIDQDQFGESVPFVSESAARPSPTNSKDSWIHEPKNYPSEEYQIAETSYWQTQITELPMAVEKLEGATIIGLSDKDALTFAGPHYKKQHGTQPYLVRGVFWNYTGYFSLFLKDDELYVSHSSLGQIRGETKLPFVINLQRAPKRVYTYMSSAL